MYAFEISCMFLIVILWDCALAGVPLSCIYLEETLRLMGDRMAASLKSFGYDSTYAPNFAVGHYRELILYADGLNDFQSFKLIFIHGLLFGQQTAEAFTAFRMLRTPGIALSDFAFLLADMWVWKFKKYKIWWQIWKWWHTGCASLSRRFYLILVKFLSSKYFEMNKMEYLDNSCSHL